VTPGGDRRDAADVGRHARLELVFGCRAGRTMLIDAYAEPPLRVGRWFAEGAGLHMIMATSAPGIFAGDSFRQSIRVERGARVRLTSQSALQVHPNAGPAARMVSTYHVQDDAELRCQWDPVIPFAGARLDQRVEIRLDERGSLYWSDAFMNGRQARGERWMFLALAHELKVWRAGLLEYLERYRIVPKERRPSGRWGGGEACYFGTVVASGIDVRPDAVERLHADLAAIGGVRAAADALDRRLLLVRLMAEAGVPFHEARARCSGPIGLPPATVVG